MVPLAAVTFTQSTVHCASPVLGLVCQHSALCLTPRGGSSAKLRYLQLRRFSIHLQGTDLSSQFPGSGQPSMQRIIMFEAKDGPAQKLELFVRQVKLTKVSEQFWAMAELIEQHSQYHACIG